MTNFMQRPFGSVVTVTGLGMTKLGMQTPIVPTKHKMVKKTGNGP